MTIRLAGLYIITPDLFCSQSFSRHDHVDSHRLNHYLNNIEATLKSGARVVQFRDKSSDDSLRIILGQALFDLCQRYGVLFIINDDVELAREIGAHGVHLGKDDVSVSWARDRLGPQAIIGVSCYNQMSLARKAQTEGADYIAFGRFFHSNTKPNAVHADIGLLTQAKKQLNIPVVAIGGINHKNAKQLLKAGADSLAVVGGVFDQEDISAAAELIVDCFISTH